MLNKFSISFFCFVVMVTSIGPTAAEIYVPSLPYIAHALKADNRLVQLSITYFLFGMAFAGIFWGYISDHIGRRKILLITISISLLGTLFCAVAFNVYWLICGRVLQGVGFSGVSGTGRALLRDRMSGVELARYTSYVNMALSLSIDLAPFVGGVLQQYFGWRAIFAILLIYSFSVLYMGYRYQEDKKFVKSKINLDKLFVAAEQLLNNKNSFYYNCITSVSYGGIMAYVTVTSFIVERVLNKSPMWFGTMILGMSLVFVAASFINGKLVGKIAIRKLMYFGLTLILLSAISFTLLTFIQLNTTAYILAIVPFFAGFAFVSSNADVMAFTYINKMIGVTNAIFSCFRQLTAVFITAIISIFSPYTTLPFGLTLLILTLMSFALLFVTQENKSVN